MEYTTLEKLKTKLWITNEDNDSELSSIITKATKLIDIKIWYNLEKQDIIKRTWWTGKNKIYLDCLVNSIEYITNKDNLQNYTLDFIDWYIVYLEEKTPKWERNIEVKYNIWFDTVPSDIEEMCLWLCVWLSIQNWITWTNTDKLQEKNIKTQKLGSLSLTYFSNQEKKVNITDRFDLNTKENFDQIIAKYKSFR